MIRLLEAAELSSHVYHSVQDKIVGQDFLPRFKGVKIENGWVTYEDVDPHMTRNKNLFARLYCIFSPHLITNSCPT